MYVLKYTVSAHIKKVIVLCVSIVLYYGIWLIIVPDVHHMHNTYVNTSSKHTTLRGQ